MSSDKLSPVKAKEILARLLQGLKLAGVEKGSRNKTVAEKTGYSVGSVNRVLSGNATLTGRFIQAVCTAFDINRRWVERGDSREIIKAAAIFTTAPTRNNNPLTEEVVSEFERLPDAMKYHVIAILKEMNADKK